MITEENIRAMVRSMNTAYNSLSEADKDAMKKSDAFTGATYVFGAMNAYLYMIDKDEDYNDETKEIIKKAFQNVVSMFKIDFDIETFSAYDSGLPKDTEVVLLPTEKTND